MPAPLPTERPSSTPDRYAAVSTVLARVLVLNLIVAAAKIGFGYATGAVSILSDGFHSLTDGSANIVALVGIRAARKPADEEHPYGHRKFETIASVAIVLFLTLAMVEVLRTAAMRVIRPDVSARVTIASFAVMIGTLAVNIFVIAYERRRSVQLGSEVLRADAMHTQSDLLTSLAVIAALAGTKLGFPILDPAAGVLVAIFIGYAAWQIAREASRILSDQAVFSREDLREVVMSVAGVLGCHHIRTRGSANHVFLDMHVWLAADMPLAEAHAISHIVKDRVMHHYPQIVDAVIHIEPPKADKDETEDEEHKTKNEERGT